jgi:SAM-dependent methyltransferase
VTVRTGMQFFEDASTHAAYQSRRESGQAPNETMERPAFEELLGDVRGLDLLDLGCGDGAYGRDLLIRGCRSYFGLDASRRMIDQAEATLQGTPGRVQHQAVEAYSFPTSAFDAVISRMTFHWLAELAPVFRGIGRCLRPGGRLVFSVEHPVVTSCSEARSDGEPRTNWIVDDYFVSGPRTALWFGVTVQKYHRTIEDYFPALRRAGFSVEDLREATPRADHIPDPAELRRRQRVPLILLISARLEAR